MESQPDYDWNEDEQAAGFVHPEPSRWFTIFLGVLTFWPILYIFLFVASIAGAIALSSTSENGTAAIFPLILVAHVGTILLGFVLMAYYSVYVLRDSRFSSDRRLLWVLVVVLGGMVGQAIFYVMWFWRRDPSVLGSPAQVPMPPTAPVPPAVSPGDSSAV